MKIYIASALRNADAVAAAVRLLRLARFVVECDWATAYLQGETDAADSGFNNVMVEAVRRCDVLILMLPGARGAHVEFGVALGLHKRCYVLYSDESELISFHRCEGVYLFQNSMALMNHLFDYRKEMEAANGQALDSCGK